MDNDGRKVDLRRQPVSHLWFLHFLENDLMFLFSHIKHLGERDGQTVRERSWASQTRWDRWNSLISERIPFSTWASGGEERVQKKKSNQKARGKKCTAADMKRRLDSPHLNWTWYGRLNISTRRDGPLMFNQVLEPRASAQSADNKKHFLRGSRLY